MCKIKSYKVFFRSDFDKKCFFTLRCPNENVAIDRINTILKNAYCGELFRKYVNDIIIYENDKIIYFMNYETYLQKYVLS